MDDRVVDFAHKPACYEAGRCWTYNDLSIETDRFADSIAQMSGPVPAVIAIRLNCTMEAIAALLAVKRCRQIALPQYTDMPIVEQEEQQRIAGASFLLNTEGIKPLISKTKESDLVSQLAKRGHSDRWSSADGDAHPEALRAADLVCAAKRGPRCLLHFRDQRGTQGHAARPGCAAGSVPNGPTEGRSDFAITINGPYRRP